MKSIAGKRYAKPGIDSKNVFERNHSLSRSLSIVRKLSLWPQNIGDTCPPNLKSEIENWA
jgi:hypothetical protein